MKKSLLNLQPYKLQKISNISSSKTHPSGEGKQRDMLTKHAERGFLCSRITSERLRILYFIWCGNLSHLQNRSADKPGRKQAAKVPQSYMKNLGNRSNFCKTRASERSVINISRIPLHALNMHKITPFRQQQPHCPPNNAVTASEST